SLHVPKTMSIHPWIKKSQGSNIGGVNTGDGGKTTGEMIGAGIAIGTKPDELDSKEVLPGEAGK
nr:hypothetical protein [Tanacetum cinerariifolium]